MEYEPSPDFLASKWQLHKQGEVNQSVAKLRREGEKIQDTKEARIDAHFRRIDRALEKWPKYLTGRIRDRLINDFTIKLQTEDGSEDTEKVDKLVKGLFESEKEILRARGMGAELEQYGDTLSPEDYDKYKNQIYDKKAEQEKSLSRWLDYFAEDAAAENPVYPTWFKYFTLRSLQNMGKRDRDTGSYSKRSANTIQPFPDLSREALAKVLDSIKVHEAGIVTAESDDEAAEEIQSHLQTYVERGDFARLYAHFQNEIEQARREREGAGTAGEWRHFAQGSDPHEIVATLAGKGTEWCTAGLDVATTQLQSGEFWIYYTYDDQKQPVDPRVAVYIIDGQISEVRGVADSSQNLEGEFTDIARQKYSEYDGAQAYEKKDHDMQMLTHIERKTKAGHELSKDDLIFLYEINGSIEGFGYERDPRIEELRAVRNPVEDAPIVFECSSEEIALSPETIDENSKAYIGPLFPAIFTILPSHLEHIYTSFPEGKISQRTIEIGGKTAAELEAELEKKHKISDYARHMLRSKEFVPAEHTEPANLVIASVATLGFPGDATIAEIYAKAEELGLEICPAEVGPHFRLQYPNQPMDEWLRVARKPIADPGGYPGVFSVGRRERGLARRRLGRSRQPLEWR